MTDTSSSKDYKSGATPLGRWASCWEDRF
jgi:hypothetical protein